MLPSQEDTLSSIEAAYLRIRDLILHTPLTESKWLSVENNCNVFLKLESEQITGSMKLRGAANKLKLLLERSNGGCLKEPLVAASSGNHALACAYAASKLDLSMLIYCPVNLSSTKEEMLGVYKNVELRKIGDHCGTSEAHARTEAEQNGLTYVSPYNDIDIINGQATVGLEILKQNPSIDYIFVSVGGGGLISGITMYAKFTNPRVKIIACQPVKDCHLYESVKVNHIREDYVAKETFSDGTAGNVESGSLTFDIVKQYVDEWLLLEENDIEQAVYDMMVKQGKIIEGAAGLVIAGARKIRNRLCGKNVALVICGANLGVKNISYILSRHTSGE